MKKFVLCLGVIVCAVLLVNNAFAAIVTTTGAGSAVTGSYVGATFDSITTYTDLTNYSENGIKVSVPQYAYTGWGAPGLTGDFHYPSGGAYAYTSISMLDGSDMHAIEFNVSNGWYSNTTYLHWQAFLDSVLVDSGSFTITSGDVFGLSTPDEAVIFDLLQVGAYSSYETAQGVTTTGGSDCNALALDNLKIQLSSEETGAGDNNPVPEPASIALLSLGLLGGYLRRKK